MRVFVLDQKPSLVGDSQLRKHDEVNGSAANVQLSLRAAGQLHGRP